MFVICIFYVFPYVRDRSDCSNECNEALQTLYDSCVRQNGYAPNGMLTAPQFRINTTASNQYKAIEYECVELLDNGSMEDAPCPI